MLVLVIAFVSSGILHGMTCDNVAAAATISAELSATSHMADDGPPCKGFDTPSQHATCGMAIGCAPCLPVASIAATGPLRSGLCDPGPGTVLSGHAISPQLHPPKAAASV